MKVLKTRIETPWRYTLTCGECKTYFEVSAGDLGHVVDWPTRFLTRCPVCAYPSGVPVRDVPEGIKQNMRRQA